MHSAMLTTVAVALLLNPASTYVLPRPEATELTKRDADPVAQLTGILSNPNACPSSTGECVTPSDALGPILDGLSKYQIDTAPEQAAVVSLMAFESVDFKFNHNVSPGRPGQGTRAMLMPNFIQEYVSSIPELADKAKAITGDSDDAKNARLKLVQDNDHSFAAASWFYSTKCGANVKSQVKTGGRAGWENYLKSCVGVTADSDREGYWKRACQQLGVPTS